MHFINPLALWLLTGVPLVGALAVGFAYWRKKKLTERYGDEALISRFSKTLKFSRYGVKAASVLLSLALLIVALARPYVDSNQAEFPIGKVDIIAMVDVSRSMAVQDYQSQLSGTGDYYTGGTRLDMARYLVVNDVISSLKYNRLGVVTYAGQAMPTAFLTQDMPPLKWMLERSMTIQSVPGDGSSMVAAFNLAFFLFQLDSSPDHKKIIVLFSDGGNDDGQQALGPIISELKKQNIELVVVGLGTLTAKPIPISQLSETDRYRASYGEQYYKYNGQVVTSALDQNMLAYLANAANGHYIQVTSPSDFHMSSITNGDDVEYKKGRQEIFFYPLLLSLLLFGLALVATRELSKDVQAIKSIKLPSRFRRR